MDVSSCSKKDMKGNNIHTKEVFKREYVNMDWS